MGQTVNCWWLLHVLQLQSKKKMIYIYTVEEQPGVKSIMIVGTQRMGQLLHKVGCPNTITDHTVDNWKVNSFYST